MTHQRVRDERQSFIEQKQREEIGGEGHANRGGKSQSETGEVTCLRVLIERTHVADRIERRQDPEDRSSGGKEKAERIYAKRQVDAWENSEEHDFRHAAGDDIRNHRSYKGEQHDACCHGPELPQIPPAFTSECNEDRAQSRNENSE